MLIINKSLLFVFFFHLLPIFCRVVSYSPDVQFLFLISFISWGGGGG